MLKYLFQDGWECE